MVNPPTPEQIIHDILAARDNYRYVKPVFYIGEAPLRQACELDGLDYETTRAELESNSWIVIEEIIDD